MTSRPATTCLTSLTWLNSQIALSPGNSQDPLQITYVSTWLNAGVPAPQVAEWAGHSVHVLMRVYAKCIYGQEEAARRRIEAALNHDPKVKEHDVVSEPR